MATHGGKGGKIDKVVSGHIEESDIQAAIQEMTTIALSYREIQERVNSTTRTVKQNWVGKGRTAFESQYNILIRKIEDFGDTLEEICDSLIEADKQYQETDNTMSRSYTKIKEGMS